MPIGPEAQIDCAATIVEIARVNRIEKAIRPVRGGVGEEAKLLSDPGAESRGKVPGAKIAETGADYAEDVFVDPGFRLNDDNASVTPSKFSRNITGDYLQRIDRVGVE